MFFSHFRLTIAFVTSVAAVATTSNTFAVNTTDGPVADEGCVAEPFGRGCCLTDPHELFSTFAGDDSIFDCLKNKQAGSVAYSVGGELRYRFMNEANRLRPPGGNAEYGLWRFNPYLNVQFNDRVGVFVEGIDASYNGVGDDPYTPVPIDVNRFDFLRYYAELGLISEKDMSLKYRYGRQFLKYGGQRLLSPLAWSNTYRNFEGHKLVYSTTDWDVDAFIMKSVNGAAGGSGFDPNSLDSADEDRWISGIYSTFRGLENSSVDFYWLYFNEHRAQLNRMDGERHTLGVRWAGAKPVKECNTVLGTWAWDMEGAWQFGRDQFAVIGSRDVNAGMATASLGYTFNRIAWAPGVKGFYYWSSGDSNPAAGDINTFYTMYPLGHAYWGLIDNFSGQNLQDVGFTLSMTPHKKLLFAATYHAFHKSRNGDGVYNIVGATIPGAGGDLGQELDLVATVPVTKNFNVQGGYFWFFYGDALSAARDDAHQFYLQVTWKF